MNCPKCERRMDFVGRYIFGVSLESAAPVHLRDYELWRCELCHVAFAESGIGEVLEVAYDDAENMAKRS